VAIVLSDVIGHTAFSTTDVGFFKDCQFGGGKFGSFRAISSTLLI
jgi:hypothetical protein